jgi:hypothetical protein
VIHPFSHRPKKNASTYQDTIFKLRNVSVIERVQFLLGSLRNSCDEERYLSGGRRWKIDNNLPRNEAIGGEVTEIENEKGVQRMRHQYRGKGVQSPNESVAKNRISYAHRRIPQRPDLARYQYQ